MILCIQTTCKPTERIKARPQITNLLPGDQTVTVGSNVTFKCEVFSDTTPHLVWMKWNNSTNPPSPENIKEDEEHISFLEVGLDVQMP